MDADTEKTAKPRRHWLRFSLRTLLVVVTVLSIPLGWVGWKMGQVRRERATITWVEEMGGQVSFRPKTGTDERSWWEESTDKWFGERVWSVYFIDARHVIDLSPLVELKNLERLTLSRTQVSDLSPLTELKNLKGLYVDRTQVSDLSPLAELENLENLNLSSTQVSDLSPLVELKSLRSLGLNNTQLSDLSPLARLNYLEDLYLRNTQVSDEQVQELRQALPGCKIER